MALRIICTVFSVVIFALTLSGCGAPQEPYCHPETRMTPSRGEPNFACTYPGGKTEEWK